jgi:hypothetical protein
VATESVYVISNGIRRLHGFALRSQTARNRQARHLYHFETFCGTFPSDLFSFTAFLM